MLKPSLRPARAQIAAPLERSQNAAANQNGDLWQDARVSLQVRSEPLPRLLALFGQMTGARFRFGSPLDAEVSPSLREAPFWPAMTNLLHSAGFRAQTSLLSPTAKSKTDLPDIWVFRRAEKPRPIITEARKTFPAPQLRNIAERDRTPPAWTSSVTWQQWISADSPGANWMSIANLDQNVARNDANWKTAEPMPEAAHRPGIGIVPILSSIERTSGRRMSADTVRLRWPLWLRAKPEGAQLLLQTPAPATLWVNGARLLRDWKGTRLIDLGSVLRVGANCLAIEWTQLSPPFVPLSFSSNEAAKEDAKAPLLRYEWLFAAS